MWIERGENGSQHEASECERARHVASSHSQVARSKPPISKISRAASTSGTAK
jgi:hypothetical protein